MREGSELRVGDPRVAVQLECLDRRGPNVGQGNVLVLIVTNEAMERECRALTASEVGELLPVNVMSVT